MNLRTKRKQLKQVLCRIVAAHRVPVALYRYPDLFLGTIRQAHSLLPKVRKDSLVFRPDANEYRGLGILYKHFYTCKRSYNISKPEIERSYRLQRRSDE